MFVCAEMMIAVEAKICEKRSKTWSGHCMQRHNSQATVTGNARTGKTPGMELAIKMEMEWLVSAILFPSAGTTTDLVNCPYDWAQLQALNLDFK
ncbi:hypothetical protein LWI28_017309 [Acer negundo]|uniref:Uncharacterized protein n=1 Tax=Acer negundo TaxID=4023 RepID=A0AAD5IZL1_ACENE|nr:hypothetical protein LWI28_017309 [Acer negundo]